MKRYPSIFALVFVIGGIVTADLTNLPSWWFLCAAMVACFCGLFSLIRRRGTTAAVLLAAALGIVTAFHFQHEFSDPGPRHLSRVVDQRKLYRIYGTVADWPDLKPERTEIKISIDSLVSDVSQPTEGSILLKVTDTTTALQRGDRVEFYGRIYPLHESGDAERFSYRRYLALKGVFGISYLPTLLDVRIDHRSSYGVLEQIDRLRDEIKTVFWTDLSAQPAALATGFLIGETRDIPSSVYSMFRDSGTLHLLAVSGSNVALVLIFIAAVMRPMNLSRRVKSLLLLGVILLFTLLSYAEPSVVRASVMAMLVITVGLLNRRYDLNNIIALTALIILLVEPGQLYDVGFQLSFATAWGLIAFTPRLTALFARYQQRRWYKWIVYPLLISLVAQVCSTPLIAYYFGRVPLVSPIANLVIVPLSSVAVIAVLIVLVAHAVLPILGLFAGSLADLLMKGVIAALHVFSGTRAPTLTLTHRLPTAVEVTLILVAYLLTALFVWSISNRRARRAVIFALLILANVAGVYTIFTRLDRGGPSMLISGVPGGVAAIVSTPNNPEGDLVLAGLASKDYPVDERILGPMLERQEIRSLRRMFVLSSSYMAIDDILRLARQYHADSLIIARDFEPSVVDVLGSSGGSDSLRIVYYQGKVQENAGLGYVISDDGLLVNLPDRRILITDRFRSAHFKAAGGSGGYVVIIGEPWHANARDWIAVKSAGYSQIICSKIELYRPMSGDREEFQPDLVRPGYLHDLSEAGSIRLHLSNPEKDRFD